jgi:hypothetical protein
MDVVHGSKDLYHRFLFRKVSPKTLENRGAKYFYRKAPLLYFNYVLDPTISQKYP